MDKRSIDKLLLKNGSLFITALTLLIPMYKTFVVMEQRLQDLQKVVDKLNTTVIALHQELQVEKTNSALFELRLRYLEHADNEPGLFK